MVVLTLRCTAPVAPVVFRQILLLLTEVRVLMGQNLFSPHRLDQAALKRDVVTLHTDFRLLRPGGYDIDLRLLVHPPQQCGRVLRI